MPLLIALILNNVKSVGEVWDPLRCGGKVADKCGESIPRDCIDSAAKCNLFEKGKSHGELSWCVKSVLALDKWVLYR